MKHQWLSGLNIIVTRPLKQAKNLQALLTHNGATTYLLPTLEIRHYKDNELTSAKDALNTMDTAIFTSKNAVLGAIPLLPKTAFKVAAIGPTTAKALIENQIRVDIMPKANYDSEHLLCLPYFQQVKNRNIVIFAGAGGRTLLEDTLRLRGAHVVKVSLYERIRPKVDLQKLESILLLTNPVFIATSEESLVNLTTIFEERLQLKWLVDRNLCVVSKRVERIAMKRGFKEESIIASQNATDQSILESLIKWYAATADVRI